ncbi:MAG: TetR/AcrR family transcriptional regulator, partial [Burkholderiales bacterium]
MSKTGKLYQPHLSTLQDRRAVRTREALRAALLELLETTPLEQITIRDIAARAGIGYATFFRHHPTKESLLDDVAAEQIGRLVELSVPLLDFRDTRAASRALCSYVDEHRALWSRLLTGGAA